MSRFSDEGLARLEAMRDHVDEKFLAYAKPETLHGNFESLSQLALIGGRLDKFIREERTARRQARSRINGNS